MSTATAPSPRAAWLEERRTGLGGSDIAAILGIDGSPIGVWASKVYPATDTPSSNRARWGKRLERAIAEEYGELTGQDVRFLGEVVMRHPEHAWWIGSPDAAVHGPIEQPADRPLRGLEIKTSGADQAWRWGASGTDAIPEKFIVQVAHYMPLLGVDALDVYALIGGNDDRVYTVHRDPKLEAFIAEEGERFWREHVLTGVPPELDASDASRWYVQHRHPRAVADVRDATPEERELLQELQVARQVFDEATDRKAALESRVKLAIGDAGGLRVGPAIVRWSDCKGRTTTDWDAVARECRIPSDVVAKHTTTAPGFRRLDWPRKGI